MAGARWASGARLRKEAMALPQATAEYRAEYRAARIGPRYSGWAHFAFVTGMCAAAICLAASQLHEVRLWELALVPLYFVVANAAEYFGHRGPMHHPRLLLRALYTRHTLEHHRFFTHEAMECESPRDFKIMLFPPVLLLFFLGGIATPLSLLCRVLVSPNAGWLFAITGVGYYLTYEWLHFAYHLPTTSWVGKLALVRVLRKNHLAHHDPSLMTRWDFNITFPLCDLVLGTLRRAP